MAFGAGNSTRRDFLSKTLAATVLIPAGWLVQNRAISFSREEKEQFLLNAQVIRTRPVSIGITSTVRATLSDGRITHDASIQCIDFYALRYRTLEGVELNFKDNYKFNIAAYRLALLLGLENLPPSVERRFKGKKGAFTWWIDDVMMDEKARYEQKIEPPDQEDWAQQMSTVNVFDQLIYNIDRNAGNLLITKDWRIWMIDHSRAFRSRDSLRKPHTLTRCDRSLLTALQDLRIEAVRASLGKYLTKTEIKALMIRRDLIVQRFESLGESSLFDGKRR
jgi:hypothetical protein